MEIHYEPVGENAVREVIDSWDVFECDKGHEWEETLENRLDIPLPISFPIPNSEKICPFCLSDFLATLGRITTTTRKTK